MEFVRLAQDLEQKTIATYESLAYQCAAHPGVHRILLMLVDDHRHHVDKLKTLTGPGDTRLHDSEIFNEVRRLLEKIQAEKDTFSCDIDQLNLYRAARDLVLEKKQLYQRARENTEGGGHAFLDSLIMEEEKQAFVLTNIIEMVERPDQWLEDAEFTHLDEY